MRVFERSLLRATAAMLAILSLGVINDAQAIPPNTPVTNIATAAFTLGGTPSTVADSAIVVSAPSAGNSPPHDLTPIAASVDENDIAAIIADLVVSDLDPADTHSFVVDDPRFVVVGSQLRLADGVSLDFEVSPSVLINVTVIDSAGGSLVLPFTITVNDVVDTPSGNDASLAILQLAPGLAGAQNSSVAASRCVVAGVPQPAPPPVSLISGASAIPGSFDFIDTNNLKSGDVLWLQVHDTDANLAAGVAETVRIQVQTPTGDLEEVELAETGADTGKFVGYINTALSAVVPSNCVLEVVSGQVISLTYTDANDTTDTTTVQILVDPFGVLFDSATGQPIDGVLVTLIDVATGNPAVVTDDDGVSPFPSSLTSGDSAFQALPGTYRFPYVASGQYRLQIVPGQRFRFPSIVADPTLQGLPGAPYALSAGSRGGVFDVPVGPAIRVDIPLDILPLQPSVGQLRLLAATSNSSSSSLPVAASACFDGASFQSSGFPLVPQIGSVTVPSEIELGETARFVRGDAVFLELVDGDQDVDPFSPDTVQVRVRTADGGDFERIELQETGASTGVFRGHIQTSNSAGAALDCALNAEAAEQFEVEYVDAANSDERTTATAVLDPGFVVFSSATGGVQSGAQVTLIHSVSGLPATDAVFGADGITAFPATVTVGGAAIDAGGNEYAFAPGTFFFPVIAPGDYRLEVVPPTDFLFPSQASDQELSVLANGPFDLRQGSRGEQFTVLVGEVVGFDLPLDPAGPAVVVRKRASKDIVSVGEFLQYQIEVRAGRADVSGAQLSDRLPSGFRYVAGSMRDASGKQLVPQISDAGDVLTLALPALAADENLELSYVLEIGSNVREGIARNQALVTTGPGVQSNVAIADVVVREDLLRSKAILVGSVMKDGCPVDSAAADNAPDVSSGAANVRVFMENGTYVVTDREGRFHIEGIEPGSHVVQVDRSTLPRGYELVLCEDNTRFAGNSGSQFVDLRGGVLWRADFYLQPKLRGGDVLTALHAQAEGDQIRYRYYIETPKLELTRLQATIVLDENVTYEAGSAVINGQQISDPSGLDKGAATFSYAPKLDAQSFELTFEVRANDAAQLITSKGVVQLVGGHGHHRSPVSVSEISRDWPTNLRRVDRANVESGETLDSLALAPSAGIVDGPGEQARSHVEAPALPEGSGAYELPTLNVDKAPVFNAKWLAEHKNQPGIAWPPEDYNPALPAIDVAVVHDKQTKPILMVDNKLADPVTFDGITTDHASGRSVTHWSSVSISEHGSELSVRILDGQDKQLHAYTRQVHFSGAPVRAEMVADQSYLVADGINPPMLAVRLFDRAGQPLRPGTTGEFSVRAPYQALDKARHLESIDDTLNNQRYQVVRDGIAFIQLEPTATVGEVQLNFRFNQLREQVLRARLKPGAREWIMVGLVEGVIGQRDHSGNALNLTNAGLDDDVVRDGRVAFYAKGMVKGDWLITAAYDTDKTFEQRLRQQIDPNQFYTLYGDGAEQRYDAQSQRKLYLKLEKSRFAALFGDFDTGFERSELARYERRLNGFSAGYYGKHVEVKAFASETNQTFVRDEIRGDGTSGIFRLSRQRLVVNSESIRVVTRDRFAPERVVEEVRLVRYLDYSIDFDRGTLLFKQPILSQDFAFNPRVIEVEYEVEEENASKDLVAGARLAYRLDEQDSELALTIIDDGNEQSGGELFAGDWTWRVSDVQKITVEMAQSENALGERAKAHLLEVEHNSEKLIARAYLREQELNFGLGNQSAMIADTRKIGAEGEYRITEAILMRGEAFHAQTLSTGGDRVVANARGEWRKGDLRLEAGLQAVDENTQDGQSRGATQVLLGAAHKVLGGKGLVRLDTEVALGSDNQNTDYPSRAIVGLEYEVRQGIDLIAEQELSWGDERDTQDTRFGVRARPWRGAKMDALVGRQLGENADRLFATTGLLQQWRLSERWMLDFGMDRVQTLRGSDAQREPEGLLFNTARPPASGSFDQDFTAAFAGIGLRTERWDATSRVEFHAGDESDKWNVLVGANRQLSAGRVMSGSLASLDEERHDGTRNLRSDLRLGFAWRDATSPWTILQRLDFVVEERDGDGFDTRSHKWVSNFNANYKPGLAHQLSLQLGLKYVLDTIDDAQYRSASALYGLAYRYDVNPRWDVGVSGAVLQGLNSEIDGADMRYSYGLSVGHRLRTDTWVSLGYNIDGFDDDEFVAAGYTAKGPYLNVRMKFDQAIVERFLEYAGLQRRR